MRNSLENTRRMVVQQMIENEALGVKGGEVVFTILHDREPRGNTIMFAVTRGPRGEIVNEVYSDTFGGYMVTGRFDGEKVLAWLDKELGK